MKIIKVIIKGESLYLLGNTLKISAKFSGKMRRVIILKVTRKQGHVDS